MDLDFEKDYPHPALTPGELMPTRGLDISRPLMPTHAMNDGMAHPLPALYPRTMHLLEKEE